MYPLAEGMFAPLNRWYVAAWHHEVGANPLERWILNQPVVFYRREDGSAVALDGRCPHRHFPLGMGKVVGDNIQCLYHGFTFGPDGRCVNVPTQSHAPSACDIRSYPVVEDAFWVWIWPGDPALADPALKPDLGLEADTDRPFQVFANVYRPVASRYALLHDNLLDLSHLEFLHVSGIGSAGAADAREQRSDGEGWVRSDRIVPEIPCPPLFRMLFGYDGLVTRRFGMVFDAPALHRGWDEFEKVPAPGSTVTEPLGRTRVWHAITPGRKQSSHYFVGAAHDFPSVADEVLAQIAAGVSATLDEDILAAEAIEAMLDKLDEEPRDVLVKSDATCVTGRRVLERMMREEGKLTSPPAG